MDEYVFYWVLALVFQMYNEFLNNFNGFDKRCKINIGNFKTVNVIKILIFIYKI